MALCVRFALPFAIAYASIQTHRQSHNNIMLSSQYPSHQRGKAIACASTPPHFAPLLKPCFLANATHPEFHHSPPPFQRCSKKIKHNLFYCLVLAVGSFTTLIRSATFRCTPFLLHYFASFISPTSAPHAREAPYFIHRIPPHCSVSAFG